MKTVHTVIAVALLAMAAFAGIVVSDAYDGAEPAEIGEFKVSYVVEGMTYVASSDKANQVTLSTIDALGAKIPQGKQFSGWESSEGTIYTAGSVITLTADTTLTAKLTDIEYTVTFMADGKTVGEAVKGIYGTTVTAPEAPAKEGYIFVGWTTSGITEPITAIPAIAGDVTYTAVYAVDHKVLFMVDGTTILTTSVDDLTVPADPAKDGFEFIGWSVDGKIVDPETYEITADVTFTASWRADTLTVQFVAGDAVLATVSVEYGKTVLAPAVEFPEGYLGWDFDFAKTITEDTVIKAKPYVAPEPEKTGLADPAVQAVLVIAGFLAGALAWAAYTGKVPMPKRKGGKR